jgi:hypothetical protein
LAPQIYISEFFNGIKSNTKNSEIKSENKDINDTKTITKEQNEKLNNITNLNEDLSGNLIPIRKIKI